jgi:hypothetical protein
VEVYTGSKSESRLVILVAGERNTALRNLTVEWMPRHTRAVHAALRQLRSHA